MLVPPIHLDQETAGCHSVDNAGLLTVYGHGLEVRCYSKQLSRISSRWWWCSSRGLRCRRYGDSYSSSRLRHSSLSWAFVSARRRRQHQLFVTLSSSIAGTVSSHVVDITRYIKILSHYSFAVYVVEFPTLPSLSVPKSKVKLRRISYCIFKWWTLYNTQGEWVKIKYPNAKIAIAILCKKIIVYIIQRTFFSQICLILLN